MPAAVLPPAWQATGSGSVPGAATGPVAPRWPHAGSTEGLKAGGSAAPVVNGLVDPAALCGSLWPPSTRAAKPVPRSTFWRRPQQFQEVSG